MSCHKIVSLLLAMALALFAPSAFALDSGDITITSIGGDVRIVIDGAPRTLKVGAALVPPATIETGKDGMVELRQGETTVSIGPDTKLDFPRLATRSGPIDRIVQQRGNAFYKIGKRGGRQLRVETPVLVGCIKGTQFNVAVDELTSTISLFEGRLEVHAIDDSDVVDLIAGQIATRKLDGASISVIKMDAGSAPVPPHATGAREIITAPREEIVMRSDPAADIPMPNDVSPGVATMAPDVGTNIPAVSAPDVATNVPVSTPVDVGVNVPAVSTPDVVTNVPGVGTPDVVTNVLDQIKNDDAALGLDDGNNGHGNDGDHDDSSNPGHSSHGGKGPSPSNDPGTVVDELRHHRK